MLNIKIRTRNSEYRAELDDSDISNTVWLSAPFTTTINMLGDEIYFEFPGKVEVKGETVKILNKNDIAFWPEANAICIFFGPTPLSGKDGKPVSQYGVLKIGNVIDDCSGLENAGDRQNITLLRE